MDVPSPWIKLTVAGDNPHPCRSVNVYHAHLNIPATPGPMTLFYPKWIPGEHGPTGPINGLAGLRITANGQRGHLAARSGGDVRVQRRRSRGRDALDVDSRLPRARAGRELHRRRVDARRGSRC